jgi:hypothetical protein
LVLAAKVFLVREKTDLGLLTEKLKTFKIEQSTKVEEVDFSLITEVKDLSASKNTLEGTFAFDDVFVVKHRGKAVPIPRTYEAPFSFEMFKERFFLTVYEKKNRANNIANEMSKALFMSLGVVVEARIDPETLKRFHEENFENTRIVFYDDVDLPNISKLSLYGEQLGNTSLYTDYLTHGKLWYIVLRSKAYGYIIGLTRNCVVTVFSRVDLPEFKTFIRSVVVPLVA